MVLGCIPCSILDTRSSVSIVGYPVKQIGEHAWLIEKAGIVIHKCPRNPFTGNRIFALSCGDNQFGQDFTLYEALRTVDRLLRGQSFIKQADL